jgi:NADPH:quinone reductase-like Zn-dependent oxidoreductase
MKAVVLHEYGGPEKLTFEDHVPEPQISGDTVLIASAAASVNPIDWKIRSGSRQKDFPLTFPAILGRDVSGVVRAVGANVKHFKPGDRVLALSNATYAELVAVDDSEATHIPDGVDRVEAAAIPLASLTDDQLVRQTVNVQKGQVVLITGALGAVGRAAVHSAKKIGAQVFAKESWMTPAPSMLLTCWKLTTTKRSRTSDQWMQLPTRLVVKLHRNCSPRSSRAALLATALRCPIARRRIHRQ